MNLVAMNLIEAMRHLRGAKQALMNAADAATSNPDHSPTVQDMIGVLPRLEDLTVDVMGALRTAKECQP